jgi:hypothetical protein
VVLTVDVDTMGLATRHVVRTCAHGTLRAPNSKDSWCTPHVLLRSVGGSKKLLTVSDGYILTDFARCELRVSALKSPRLSLRLAVVQYRYAR